MDGTVVAAYDYTPLPHPFVGTGQLAFPPRAWVTDSRLFFVDGAGTVRSLAPSGTVSQLATFPITSPQQLISFIVSPDAVRFGAIVVTLPPTVSGQPEHFQPGAHATLDLQWADAGGPTITSLHKDLGDSADVFLRPTLFVAWDGGGPLAIMSSVGSTIAAPAAGAGYPAQVSTLVHLATDGTHLDVVAGQNCSPVDEVYNMVAVCTGGNLPGINVKDQSGTGVWGLSGSPFPDCPGAKLSPAIDHLACIGDVLTIHRSTWAPSQITKSDLSSRANVSALRPAGWLDEDHAVYVDPTGSAGFGLVDGTSGEFTPVPSSGSVTYIGALVTTSEPPLLRPGDCTSAPAGTATTFDSNGQRIQVQVPANWQHWALSSLGPGGVFGILSQYTYPPSDFRVTAYPGPDPRTPSDILRELVPDSTVRAGLQTCTVGGNPAAFVRGFTVYSETYVSESYLVVIAHGQFAYGARLTAAPPIIPREVVDFRSLLGSWTWLAG